MWYANREGFQLFRLAMPPNAIGVNSTVRTTTGVHRLRFDRWGDHSHKFDPYRGRFQPSGRAGMEISRYNQELQRASSTPPHPSRNSRSWQERRYRNQRAERLRRALTRSPYHPEAEDLSSTDERGPSEAATTSRPRARRPRGCHKTDNYYPPSPQYISNRPQTPEEEVEDNNQGAPAEVNERPPTPEAVGFPLRRAQSMDHLPTIPEGEDVPDSLRQNVQERPVSPATPTDPPSPQGPAPPLREGALTYLQRQLNMVREQRNLNEERVHHMDKPETSFANGGIHRDRGPLLQEATQHHVVFCEPPASPQQGPTTGPTQRPSEEQTQAAPEPAAVAQVVGQLLGTVPVRDPQAPTQHPTVPLEPQVIINNPREQPQDPDCQITGESPAPQKPKSNWALRKQPDPRKRILIRVPKILLLPNPPARLLQDLPPPVQPDSSTPEAGKAPAGAPQDRGTESQNPQPGEAPEKEPESGPPYLY